MTSAAATTADAAASPAKTGGKRKLLLLAGPAVLAALVAGLWFSGVLPGLLHKEKRPDAMAHPADQPNAEAVVRPPTYVDLPEIVANLNSDRRTSFIKLHARLEVAAAEDAAKIAAAMPRLLDLFQTYLREMRPDELRGSAGTWRLREELVARANIAASPARVTDVLFTEMLVQ